MVDIEEVVEEPSPSKERLLDAEEIEKVAATLTRPTAQMHLTALAKKLRKESEALKRIEQSQAKAAESSSSPTPTSPPPASIPVVEIPKTPVSIPAVAPPPPASSSVKYTTIDRFAFDDGGYKNGFVTLYVPLPGVGSISKDNVKCEFGTSQFDLVVDNLNGKSYRLKKDHLEKDIVVEKSKYLIKADKIIVKLAKVKSEYGSYDHWSKLTDNKRGKSSKKVDNPASGIMDLMKDMVSVPCNCLLCPIAPQLTISFLFSVRQRRRQYEKDDWRDHDEATKWRIRSK
jgi:calcyclin binding protein